jgi:hypothetical protein
MHHRVEGRHHSSSGSTMDGVDTLNHPLGRAVVGSRQHPTAAPTAAPTEEPTAAPTMRPTEVRSSFG